MPSAMKMIGRRRWLGTGGLALAGLTLDGCVERLQAERSPRPGVAATGRIRLDLNENPFGPSPRAVEAIRRGLVDLARYTSCEAEDLQRQVAAAEGVLPEQIVLGDVLEAIAVHLALAGGPGEEFVYSTPGYAAFGDSAQTAGGTPVGVPLDVRLENDSPSLAAKVGDRTRALFVVNPHNPSGTGSRSGFPKRTRSRATRCARFCADRHGFLSKAGSRLKRTIHLPGRGPDLYRKSNMSTLLALTSSAPRRAAPGRCS